MSKALNFCHLQEIYVTNSEKKLIGTATKIGLDVAKPASISSSLEDS